MVKIFLLKGNLFELKCMYNFWVEIENTGRFMWTLALNVPLYSFLINQHFGFECKMTLGDEKN